MYFYGFSSKWNWLALIILFQCKAIDSSEGREKEFQTLVTKNIGKEYLTVLNESKTFILCTQNIPTTKLGMLYINFLVIELKTNSIVETGKYLHGHCKWINDSTIEVVDMPGILKDNQLSTDFRKVIVINHAKTQSL